MEKMAPAFLRRDELLDLVTEEEGPNLVIVDYSGEREHGRDLGYQIVLGHSCSPE